MYIAYADAGVDPKYFPEAPTVALPIALEKAGLKPADIAAWEVNEAFSVVVRIVEKVLGVDPSKINVNGCAKTFFWLMHLDPNTMCLCSGAVALGHAIGNSGSRIIVSLVHTLKAGEYGAAGICNGVRSRLSLIAFKDSLRDFRAARLRHSSFRGYRSSIRPSLHCAIHLSIRHCKHVELQQHGMNSRGSFRSALPPCSITQ